MKALVLLSGGIDSTVVLAELVRDHNCQAITFCYGQTHMREVQAAEQVANYYGIKHRVLELGSLFGASALTGAMSIPEGHADRPDATVVPSRNLVLLSTAAAIADADGGGLVAFGANKDDEAGYPDCRRKFVESLRDAIVDGTAHHVWLHAPLLGMSKRAIVALGRKLAAPLDLTWSCYRGGQDPCHTCGACVSREEAMQ